MLQKKPENSENPNTQTTAGVSESPFALFNNGYTLFQGIFQTLFSNWNIFIHFAGLAQPKRKRSAMILATSEEDSCLSLPKKTAIATPPYKCLAA